LDNSVFLLSSSDIGKLFCYFGLSGSLDMIDIYLIPINQLLTQRCDSIGPYARAILPYFTDDINTLFEVDESYFS